MNSPPALFESFERIVIINLPERKDRRREMMEQLQAVGLDNDARVKFHDAVRLADPGRFGSIGAHGCFMSHLQVLNENRDRSVLILEDDCDFTPSVFQIRLAPDFDIFYGGVLEASEPSNLEQSDIIGAHCMGLASGAGGKVADYLEALLADRVEHDPRAIKDPSYDPDVLPPIDGAYVWFRRAHPEFKTVFADPQMAVQRPSRTDIGDQRFFDQIPLLRDAANWGRRIKRRLS